MIVQPIQLAALDWAAAAAGTLARPWKVGSIVSGRVLEALEGTDLILQINGLTVTANPPPAALVPRQFQARVLSNAGQPVLELLAEPDHGTATGAALRTRVPHQDGFQPLLADLEAVMDAPGERSLPEPVRAAMARLEASITDRSDLLDPDVLRDAVQRSGLQLEYQLLQHARAPGQLSTTAVDYDLKGALERLVQALQQLPDAELAPPPRAAGETRPPLLQLPLQPQGRVAPPAASDALAITGGMLVHARAALARIEIMQLEAQPANSPQAWMIEVPVRGEDGFDVLQIRVRDESGTDPAPGAARWTLEFTLDPPALGPTQGQIRLSGTQVDVDLWATHAEAVGALEEQCTVLGRLLEGAGLRPGQVRVRQGLPVRHTGFGHSLLEASA